MPQAHFGPIKVPDGPPDERFLYLSDILPTAWQGVEYAEVPDGGTIVVFGLGPVGQLACRVARHRGLRVIGVDPVATRLELAATYGVEVIDPDVDGDPAAVVRELTDGRGADGALDAVGMEAHGSPVLGAAVSAAVRLPDRLAKPMVKSFGVDRLAALMSCVDSVRRGGTVSVSGVYGGMADPMPMMTMFDKGITLRMGQCHVKRWIGDLLPLALDDVDPLGLETLATHRLSLVEAARGYELFQAKADGCVKVVLRP